MSDALHWAIRFHDCYEELAPKFGYESRYQHEAWEELPENNRLLMLATVTQVLKEFENAVLLDAIGEKPDE